MRRDRRLEAVAMARRERAVQVAAVGDHPRLVERRPHLDPAVELAEHDRRVVGEPVGDVGVEPAAAIVERRGQVPVDTASPSARCRSRAACRPAARRSRGPAAFTAAASLRAARGPTTMLKRYAFRPSALHQRDVVGVAPIVVAGDVAGVAVAHSPGVCAKRCQMLGPGAVGERRAFDLVGRRRAAPQEARREIRCDLASSTCLRYMVALDRRPGRELVECAARRRCHASRLAVDASRRGGAARGPARRARIRPAATRPPAVSVSSAIRSPCVASE